MCAYQGVRTVWFSENFVCFVFLLPPCWDSSFCFITDEIGWKLAWNGLNTFQLIVLSPVSKSWVIFYSILHHWFLSIPSENIRKPRFQRVSKFESLQRRLWPTFFLLLLFHPQNYKIKCKILETHKWRVLWNHRCLSARPSIRPSVISEFPW